MKYTILLLLVSGGLLFAADRTASDEQAVRTAVQHFNELVRQGDEAALDKMLSPDLIYVHSTARIQNKAECLAELVKNKAEYQVTVAKVNFYGNTAVVHGTLFVTAAGTKSDMMQVWVKTKAGWQMVARHTARIPS